MLRQTTRLERSCNYLVLSRNVSANEIFTRTLLNSKNFMGKCVKTNGTNRYLTTTLDDITFGKSLRFGVSESMVLYVQCKDRVVWYPDTHALWRRVLGNLT